MAPRERDQLLAIRRPQRSDNRNVVATRTIESIRESIGIRSDAVDLLRKLLDRLDEACIAAQLVQCAVKMQVAVEYRQQIAAVDGLAMLALDFIEPVDVTAGNGERQNSNRHDLQFLTYRVDFHNLLRREVAHHRAAIWNALTNPFFLELEKSKADVGAMSVKLLAEILLDQPLSRVASTQHYIFF